MKKIVGTVVVVALLLGWGVGPAAAGSASRHRFQGAAIALGTLGLLGVIGGVVHAQPVAVGVGVSYPGYFAPVYGPPPPPQPCVVVPPPARVWVPGYWDYVDVWVPAAVWVASSRGGYGGDCDEQYRGSRHRGRRDHDGYRSGHAAGRERGHYERRRVWRDGYYR